MRWRRIACLGCLIILVVGISIAFIFFDTFKEFVAVEFSESNIKPSTRSIASVSPSGSEEINDIAFIQVLAIEYTDDADPEYEGISIDISFYDSKSEVLSFKDVPLVIEIELYAYRDSLAMFELENADLVYEGSVNLDHSMRLGEMFGKYIRIPFEEISIDPSIYQPFGTVRVIVSTPQQGEFEAKADLTPLFPSLEE
jgi:hypothetical protein